MRQQVLVQAWKAVAPELAASRAQVAAWRGLLARESELVLE